VGVYGSDGGGNAVNFTANGEKESDMMLCVKNSFTTLIDRLSVKVDGVELVAVCDLYTGRIERAKENGFSIVRPYCCGWMFPLYFQGHTQIVDALGNVVAKSATRNKTEVITAELVR
jgi:hypothetical protein